MKFVIYLVAALVVWITELFLGKKLAHANCFEREYISFSFLKPDRESRTLNVLLNVMYPNFFVLIIYYSIVHYLENYNAKNIWVIVLFYYMIRMAWIYLEGRSTLINKSAEVVMAFMGTGISVLLYYWYYVKGFNLSLSSEELINTVWITMIIFLYEVVKNLLDEVTWHSEDYYRDRYIEQNYKTFIKKYDTIVTSVLDIHYKDLSELVYAVMIYENYNRPSLHRGMEWIWFLLNFGAERKMTLGVMQVESSSFIKNRESVELGTKKILESYLKYKESSQEDRTVLFYRILEEYNLGDQYGGEVLSILEMIEGESWDEIEDEEAYEVEFSCDDEIEEYITYNLEEKDLIALIYYLILEGEYVLEQRCEDHAIVENYTNNDKKEILIVADDEEVLETLLKEKAQERENNDHRIQTIVYYSGIKRLPEKIYGVRIVTPYQLSCILKQDYNNTVEEVKRIVPMERKWSIIER